MEARGPFPKQISDVDDRRSGWYQLVGSRPDSLRAARYSVSSDSISVPNRTTTSTGRLELDYRSDHRRSIPEAGYRRWPDSRNLVSQLSCAGVMVGQTTGQGRNPDL